jgi:hypothetical protein
MKKSSITFFCSLLVVALVFALASTSSADGNKGWFKWRHTVEGSGNLVTQEREVDSFVNIDAGGSFDIEITVGPQASVEVTFDDNIVDLIDTRVRGKTLFIDSDASWSSSRGCKVEITVPLLESLSLNGSGDVDIRELKGKFFECEINGSGDIVATGEIEELEIDISGSGDVDARNLKAKNVYVRIQGSGDVDVYASEDFDGAVYGSGDIKYYGNPKYTNTHVAGSGSIRHR